MKHASLVTELATTVSTARGFTFAVPAAGYSQAWHCSAIAAANAKQMKNRPARHPEVLTT